MAQVFKPIGNVLGGVLKGVGLISTPKSQPTALPAATRDDAVQQQASDDELARRKGGAADLVNGAAGAGTPLDGGKLILGA